MKGKSDENSNGKTLKIVAGVLGGVGGAGAAAGLVVGGSKLIKKQASVKNSEEDKSNKNSKEDESKKNSKEDKSKKDSKKRKSKNEKDKTDADNAEGGRSSAAADSTGVKADQNSAEENQKVEYINEERLKNTHSDKDTRKEKPNDSSFSFAVGERGPPPIPQNPPARLEPLKPKKEKSKMEKKDAEENSNI